MYMYFFTKFIYLSIYTKIYLETYRYIDIDVYI